VGIPLATFDVNDWVETDWLRVRRLVTDAPSVAVGAETNTP
jgi:hypothetical protein